MARPYQRVAAIRTGTAAFVLMMFIGASTSCAATNPLTEVRAACRLGLPDLSSQSTPRIASPIQALNVYEVAQHHAAAAASADPRWEKLNGAYGAMVTAWTALVATVGPRFPGRSPPVKYAASVVNAAAIIKTECAKAIAAR